MRKWLSLFIIFVIIILFIRGFYYFNIGRESEAEKMQIVMKIGDNTYPVILQNNKTVEEFVALLPIEIIMSDLNKNEKYYYFNRKFSVSSTKVSKIEVGDIMLFGENCFVLFYESFATSYSYTKIGRVADIDSLKEKLGEGSVRVSFYKS